MEDQTDKGSGCRILVSKLVGEVETLWFSRRQVYSPCIYITKVSLLVTLDPSDVMTDFE